MMCLRSAVPRGTRATEEQHCHRNWLSWMRAYGRCSGMHNCAALGTLPELRGSSVMMACYDHPIATWQQTRGFQGYRAATLMRT